MRLPLGAQHEDDRGTITDLLVEPFDSLTRVITKKGAVRGNHYHAKTHQWAYIASGKLRIVSRDPAATEPTEDVFEAGDLMLSPPLEAHAWEALEDTTVIVATRGPRSGENYEHDTVRLPDDEKLI